jgi:hypothetical protein
MENSMKLKKFLIPFTTFLFIIMLLVAQPKMIALADSLGPRNAGAGADVPGIGTVTWGNPGNITTAGSPYAGMSVSSSSTTHYLQGTQYGFIIPPGSTINGITVVIRRQSSGMASPFLRDNVVSLVKGGTITGDNKAATGVNWPTGSLGTATYGSSSDLWGTTWTAADINATNFGVVLSAVNPNTDRSRDATVDYMQITVNYTPGTTTTVNCGSGTPVVTYGDTITCVATVARTGGSNTPSGTVSWITDGSGSFATSPCTLSGSGGTSTCSVDYTPASVGSGSHLITATYAGDANLAGSSGNQTVTVDQLPASVTPDAASKIYGDADPTLTGTLTGFLVADGVTATYNRLAGETVAGSPYLISATLSPAEVLGNYDITYNTANFTITMRAITVTADAKSKVVGQPDPILTYQVTSGSLAFSDSFTGALTRVAGESVGTYPIQQGTLALDDNYTLTYVGANLTITSYIIYFPIVMR